MAYNDPQLLHLDGMLTNISVGYDNPDEFMASNFFPSVRVGKQSDKYYVFNRDLWGRRTDDLRYPGSEANELPPMTLSRDTYFIEEHALEDVVPDEEIENADNPLQPAQDATTRLTNTILLNRELAMTDILFATGNYATNHVVTLSGTAQWNDYTNSDPIADVKTARSQIHRAIFRDPNTVIMGYEVAVKLEDHPDFIERIKYSQPGITNDQIIAAMLGIPNFRRAGAGYLTSAYGAAETTDYVWGKNVVLAWVPPNPGRRIPSFAYEFVQPYGAGLLQPTERWREEKRKSDVVRVSRRYDLKLIAVDGTGKSVAGYLIKNAIA